MVHGRVIPLLVSFLSTFSFAAWAGSEYRAGEFIVKLKGNLNISQQSQLFSKISADKVATLSREGNLFLVRRPMIERTTYVVEKIESDSRVDYVEPNYIYHMDVYPNDPELSRLWGLVNTGQKSVGDLGTVEGKPGIDIEVEKAWDIHHGSADFVIAIIDTGMDYNNPDLASNVWVNEVEAQGQPNVDDDGNGFIDDIHGYDFANNDADPMDDQGHGSHVAGTIGAKGDNNIGVVGVNWEIKMMPVKFLGADGSGSLSTAIQSIDYATKMKVKVMNNSWGGGPYSKALQEAIQRAHDQGILFVAAAGNDGENNDQNPHYPSSYTLDNILSVAAIDNAGHLADFSNFGPTTVHVGAPGVNIVSTTIKGLESWSGTSMATPHVTGVAALVWSNDSKMTYADVKKRLMDTARPLGALRGKVVTGGFVNAYHALINTVPPDDPDDPFLWAKMGVTFSTPHPYPSAYKDKFEVRVPGARRIAAHFSNFETEANYDKVTFQDGNGKAIATWSGDKSNSYSPVVDGEVMFVIIEADTSVQKNGFDLDHVAYQ